MGSGPKGMATSRPLSTSSRQNAPATNPAPSSASANRLIISDESNSMEIRIWSSTGSSHAVSRLRVEPVFGSSSACSDQVRGRHLRMPRQRMIRRNHHLDLVRMNLRHLNALLFHLANYGVIPKSAWLSTTASTTRAP